MTRIDFVRQRDGDAAVEPYKALMRRAYRAAVLKSGPGKKRIGKHHPFYLPWITGYLEFR